jgi:hypothetical protein
MGRHIMKTTIDIADPLLERARKIAARDGDTLRALIEAGLARELEARQAKGGKPFKLRQVTVGGKGLQAEAAHLSMHDIVLKSYGDRGG